MFERIERASKVEKDTYADAIPGLRLSLLERQFELKELAAFPMIVVVAGVPGAGRSDVVNLFKEWFDSRALEAHAFGGGTVDTSGRPPYWKYWLNLPARGRIGLYFGSWYTDTLVARGARRMSASELAEEAHRIESFERTLADEGALIVKIWLHLEKDAMAERLEKLAAEGAGRESFHKRYWRYHQRYGRQSRASAQMLALTDTPHAPWFLVDASQTRHRNLRVAQHVLKALEERIEEAKRPNGTLERPPVLESIHDRPLDHVDLSLTIDDYSEGLTKAQRKITRYAWRAYDRNRSTVVLLEGWDAAGKGGAIRRFIHAVDARLVRVIPISAPTEEERDHHYLWRFWRHLPAEGKITVFDRSWYGRVLVERVEGYASEAAYKRAYREINEFERHLTDHGVVLLKFFLHISPEEQLSRFEARQRTPYKRHKITEEDWRNRDKWPAYEEATNEMVTRTDLPNAPWHLVPANDKRYARVRILQIIAKAWKQQL